MGKNLDFNENKMPQGKVSDKLHLYTNQIISLYNYLEKYFDDKVNEFVEKIKS
jgi:hypothetical protein